MSIPNAQIPETTIHTLPPIFKVDSKGKIRVHQMYSEGDTFYQSAGIFGGKQVVHKKVCKGKNIGKSNEVKPEDQAIKEMKAKRVSKLKEGYFETIAEAEGTQVLMPMLAKVYEKEAHKINWGTDEVHVQPKYDGIRCISQPGKPNSLVSRKNRPIDTCAHIAQAIRAIDFPYPLDGELYVEGLSFQEVTRLVKKYRPGKTGQVQYFIYDIVAPELTFRERSQMIRNLFNDPKVLDRKCLVRVPTHEITAEFQIAKINTHYLRKGYEGTMVRWGDEGYKINGRSSHLLKNKEFIDITVTIKDVMPMEVYEDQGRFLVELDNGITCKPNPKCSFEKRKYILQNPHEFIGTKIELRFFEYMESGVPRFPVALVHFNE